MSRTEIGNGICVKHAIKPQNVRDAETFLIEMSRIEQRECALTVNLSTIILNLRDSEPSTRKEFCEPPKKSRNVGKLRRKERPQS